MKLIATTTKTCQTFCLTYIIMDNLQRKNWEETSIWVFTKIGVGPPNHPFVHRVWNHYFFHHPFWGFSIPLFFGFFHPFCLYSPKKKPFNSGIYRVPGGWCWEFRRLVFGANTTSERSWEHRAPWWRPILRYVNGSAVLDLRAFLCVWWRFEVSGGCEGCACGGCELW